MAHQLLLKCERLNFMHFELNFKYSSDANYCCMEDYFCYCCSLCLCAVVYCLCFYLDTTTPVIITTYSYERYQIATFSLAALLVVCMIGLTLVSVALMRTRAAPVQKTYKNTRYF